MAAKCKHVRVEKPTRSATRQRAMDQQKVLFLVRARNLFKYTKSFHHTHRLRVAKRETIIIPPTTEHPARSILYDDDTPLFMHS